MPAVYFVTKAPSEHIATYEGKETVAIKQLEWKGIPESDPLSDEGDDVE
jgi:hypothetical protein